MNTDKRRLDGVTNPTPTLSYRMGEGDRRLWQTPGPETTEYSKYAEEEF